MPVNLGAHVKLSEANNSVNVESHFPKRLKIIQSPTEMLGDILNQNTFPLVSLAASRGARNFSHQSHWFA